MFFFLSALPWNWISAARTSPLSGFDPLALRALPLPAFPFLPAMLVPPCPPTSDGRPAAVDEDDLSVDVARRRRRQEGDHVGDLSRAPESLEESLVAELFEDLHVLGLGAQLDVHGAL